MLSASLIVGVDWLLLQDASMIPARHKGIDVLPKMFTLPLPLLFVRKCPLACIAATGRRLASPLKWKTPEATKMFQKRGVYPMPALTACQGVSRLA